MNSIEALALTKRLDGKEIVAGVDMAVALGEVVGVLGPNGSGKSTMLRMLATATCPTSGGLRFFGEPVMDYATLRRRIGYVSDSIAHFGDLTGMENALMFAGFYGLAPAQAKRAIVKWFEHFELEADANKRVKKYSFGMKRKLAIIEGLLHDPEILLFDEPTIGLDYASEQKFYSLIREWSTRGKAVVIATNNVKEAESVCDRVVFMHKGSLVADGKPGELIGGMGNTRALSIEITRPISVVPTSGKHFRSMQAAGYTVSAIVDSDPWAVVEVSKAIAAAGGDIRKIDVKAVDLGSVFMEIVGEEVGLR